MFPLLVHLDSIVLILYFVVVVVVVVELIRHSSFSSSSSSVLSSCPYLPKLGEYADVGVVLCYSSW